MRRAANTRTQTTAARTAISRLRRHAQEAFALEHQARLHGVSEESAAALTEAWRRADLMARLVLSCAPVSSADRAARVEARVWLDGDASTGAGLAVAGEAPPVPGTLECVNLYALLADLEDPHALIAVAELAATISNAAERFSSQHPSGASRFVMETLGGFGERLSAAVAEHPMTLRQPAQARDGRCVQAQAG